MSTRWWRRLAPGVVLASLVAVAPGAATPPAGAAASRSAQADIAPAAADTQVPPPGTGLSPEVAAVPASSPELDRTQASLDRLLTERDAATQELVGLESTLAEEAVELGALRSTAARRAEQLDKAEVVAERSRRALRELTVDRFVEGDHLLEGLDPALSAERRVELGRQLVLGSVGTDRLLVERRYTAAREAELQGELDELAGRIEGLEVRQGELSARRAELQQRLGELDAAIPGATAARDRARLGASVDGTDLSTLALDAYWRAERYVALRDPGCGLSWATLAGIGRTESRHGTYRGATLATDGVVSPPIYGPDLDGSNEFAVVPDSDGGRLDATSRTDRAVGPMQFLPGTWRVVGTDLDGDGTADPQNLFDAAAAAGVYLCRSGPGLGAADRRRAAILTYNRSEEYADVVEERAAEYAGSVPLG